MTARNCTTGLSTANDFAAHTVTVNVKAVVMVKVAPHPAGGWRATWTCSGGSGGVPAATAKEALTKALDAAHGAIWASLEGA